jgi:rubrerythrin
MADLPPQARIARSRRAFIRVTGATFLGGSAAAIAACGGGKKQDTQTTISTTQAQGDAAVLNAALELEHTAIAAYETGLKQLKGAALADAREFLAHERQHAAALTKAVAGLGSVPVKPRPMSAYAAGFPALGSASDFLNFALDIESTAVAAYLDSLAALNTPPLRSEVASIMTNEAEHLAVISGLLGRPQVPSAFVTGESPS